MTHSSSHSHDHHEHSSQHEKQSRLVIVAKTLFVFIVIGGALYTTWHFWPDLLMAGIRWQRSMIDKLSELLQTANQSSTAMYGLVELSFIYGIFHSLGPGHGKMVVSTYLITHPTKVRISLWITIISALVQALVAIALVGIFLLVIHTSMRHVNHTVENFIQASGLGIAILGIYLIYKGVKGFWASYISRYFHSHEHENEPEHEHDAHNHSHHQHEHVHHHDANGVCACGHKHAASAEEINQVSSLRECVFLILSIGIRPCTGAILALFFANIAGMFWLGVISALLMAVGTAITTSTIALLTVSGKKFVRYYLSYSGQGALLANYIIRTIAGLILILFAYILIHQSGFGMSPIYR